MGLFGRGKFVRGARFARLFEPVYGRVVAGGDEVFFRLPAVGLVG